MIERFKFRKAAFLGSLLIAILVLLTLASFHVTSDPKFCGSCHIMKPYYESWKTSSHNKIDCVDCHIPPGVTSELRKKYEAISMVVRYFTATYGTHPWAEVDDVNCLQCHERRLIAGKESFEKGIHFDHTPHLTEMRRQKKLRCTSCHSQIVQGSHIAVTTTTCILCHFKDQKPGTSTARCELCHNVPEKTIVKGNIRFNHSDVKKFDMKCEWCHAGVVRGEGDVPRTRCLSCHNEIARIQEYDKTEHLHQIHVTDHKVQCLLCHNVIQHGTRTVETHAPQNSCEGCHKTGHSPQQSLYAGVGGIGVQSIPSPMYLAGVTCEGCHFLSKEGDALSIQRASAISCMACHGAYFGNIFKKWENITSDRLQVTKTILADAERQLSSPYPLPLQQAQDNVRLVERASPIHNVQYSLSILDKSVDLMNAALKEKGKNPVNRPWQSLPFSSPCFDCHQGIETQSGTFGGRTFAHAPHVIKNEFDCDLCHVEHELPVKSSPISIQPSDCASCHHDGDFASKCLQCHKSDIARPIRVQGEILDRKGLNFNHDIHLQTTEKKCADCHIRGGSVFRTPAKEICAECHG